MKFSKESYIGLGKVPIGVGAVLKGWNISEKHFRNPNLLPVVDFRAMTPACPHNCFHCFTDKLKKTLTLEDITGIIDQLATMKTKAIDFLGEGEPTVDKDFFKIIKYTASKGIQPIVFTDAATKLRNKNFIKKLYESGASVCPKCDSLWNPKYQNWVVGDKTGKYFDQRNAAIKMLMKKGFNKIQPDGTTRLGFDMVVCKKNMNEVERTLRYCRKNNLWIIFSFFLPCGRSGRPEFDKAHKSLILTGKEKKKIQDTVRRVDEEYGFTHDLCNNFMTSRCIEFMCIYGDGRVSPCTGNETIVGNVKIDSIKELRKKIIKEYPVHNPRTFDGNCPYRKSV